MPYKILKVIISFATIIAAVFFSVRTYVFKNITDVSYNQMSLALLICIAFTGVVESLGQDTFLSKIQKQNTDEIGKKLNTFNTLLENKIDTISDCQTFEFNSSYAWAEFMDKMISEGDHCIDTASLDSSVRSKKEEDHKRIWEHILNAAKNPRINFRHVVRIRKNNYFNLLERISTGSIKEKSYYSYYELPQEFSFTTFGIIDNQYVSLRSPYEEGMAPKYYIIKNKYVADIFSKWFDNLWLHSNKIETIDDLDIITKKYTFTDEELKIINSKIEVIRRKGLIPDI